MPALAIIAIIAGIALLVADPSLAKTVDGDIKDFFGSIVSGTTQPVFEYWIAGSLVVSVLGIVTWVVVDSIANKRGEKVAPPTLGQIGPGAAPSFHTESGIKAGPVSSSGGLGQ
jgi:hypothetical protein